MYILGSTKWPEDATAQVSVTMETLQIKGEYVNNIKALIAD